MVNKVPQTMLDVLSEGDEVVYHKEGSTWNDGGSYHTIVVKTLRDNYIRVHMASDYRPTELTYSASEPWPPEDKDAKIQALTSERDALQSRVEELEKALFCSLQGKG